MTTRSHMFRQRTIWEFLHRGVLMRPELYGQYTEGLHTTLPTGELTTDEDAQRATVRNGKRRIVML
jgi:hypothetical protein